MFFKIFFIIAITTFSSLAEYRVYQYYVRPAFPQVKEKQEYIVTSSLDPVSYLSYHGGDDVLQVELARTWMCPGATSQLKPYCKSPYRELGGKAENKE